ncbi:MAG: class I SAM-dependent methyltransferase [Verrucomicrobiota bacterium]|nr:class I SAM-dependent methyltransferase [Verrucomicrobiota bacterium]
MKENQASATARLIARSMVFLSCDETFKNLVPPQVSEMSKWFVEETGSVADRWLLKRMDQKGFRSLLLGFERISLPGILLHYLLRKLFLEEIARAALREEFRQVVILGAGFDTLALRLCREHPKAHFVEIDHPMTQCVKQAALFRRRLKFENLVFIPADFSRQNLEQLFSENPHIKSADDTLIIAEGILMYLTPPKVAALFETAHRTFHAKCHFIFTVMEPTKNGQLQFHNANPMVNLWLRLKTEPFCWGISPEDLSDFLNANGFKLRETAAEQTFRERYLSHLQNSPLAQGEYIGVAERA